MTTTDRDDLVAYEDGDCLVVCDPANPNAWIRSSEVVPVGDEGRQRARRA